MTTKAQVYDRGCRAPRASPRDHLGVIDSSPEFQLEDHERIVLSQKGQWTSDTVLSARTKGHSDVPERLEARGDEPKNNSDQKLRDIFQAGERNFFKSSTQAFIKENFEDWKNLKECKTTKVKNHKGRPGQSAEDEALNRQIREIQHDARRSARIIRDSKARLIEMHKKEQLNSAEIHELAERNELLLREMERFERLTKTLQRLVESEVVKAKSQVHKETTFTHCQEFTYEAPVQKNHEIVMARHGESYGDVIPATARSKSEEDLTRKLNESYDMQEKLVADNAELEVKRYILYKELMTKDQVLETCRSQVKRLQGELKLVTKENALLHKKLSKNNPEGDAAALKQDSTCQSDFSPEEKTSNRTCEELTAKLEFYKNTTTELEKQLKELEVEARHIHNEMDISKSDPITDVCKSSKCFDDKKGGPPIPALFKGCGVCPPCPAPCNPEAPPTPAEKEVARLSIQLRNTEENFKVKITECSMLRAELMKKKEELEKERCQHRDTQNKLRELELRFQGLATTTNMNLGTKEQAFENEVNVRALKRCYREARDEIDELRTLIKEQNEQLQEYRVKYLQAQQLVEEQKRQMDVMDLDNTRISEQINLEIQKVKIKFQEKLQELAAIPDLLKATQARLKDSQQAQALAEHKAEQLARELNCAREKVHMLLYQQTKPPPEKPSAQEKSNEEKQMMMLNQRVTQLQEINANLKTEIERLKSNIIKLEEAVLANERRLHEKMHECAQLGGELDRCREEAARAVARAQERLETTRKCLQTTIAELEKQLASCRAQVKTAEKEREELQSRMQCQIQRLNENLEQGQLRILSLQTQMRILRKASSSDVEDDANKQECACKAEFAHP